MVYRKKMKFDYRSNGELKSLHFDLFFSHSGHGRECLFGEKSHYDVVDFRNAWRDKTGLPKQGRWNPGSQGSYESMTLSEMRSEVYFNGVNMGQNIENFFDIGKKICLWLPPSNSQRDGREKHEHMGTIFGLGSYNSLTQIGFDVELISEINASDFFLELFSSDISLIFVDETLMDGNTVISKAMTLASICTDLNINPPSFSVFVDFRKARKVDEGLAFPNRTNYGFTSRKTRDASPEFPDWSKLLNELHQLIET
jgi:hypothetical protein